jgi:hypothetical protein
MRFLIEEKLGQEIINYLSTRPYGEVWTLINKLQQLEKHQEKKKRIKKEPPLKVVKTKGQ